MTEPVRLQRFLAAAGVAARRKAEALITEGRVTVNGQVVRVLGTKVDPTHDSVNVDGEPVVALDFFYVLLNKPKGCITAVTDDRGRPTVMDYLPNLPVPVKPVGRLDFYTEGVLLLTNDGDLAARLLARANHVPKTYHAKVHGRVTPQQLTKLRAGVELEDGDVTEPAEVALLPSESKYSWVAVTIYEGKHHQVHRMFETLGFRLDKLQRVAFANLTFHHLRVGDARELTQQELNQLRDTVGLPRGPVARGRWHALREATDRPRRTRAQARAVEADAAATALEPGGREPGGREPGGREPGGRDTRVGRETSGRDTRVGREKGGRDTHVGRGGGRDTHVGRGGGRGPRVGREPSGRGPREPGGRGPREPSGRGPREPGGRGARATKPRPARGARAGGERTSFGPRSKKQRGRG